MSDYGDFRPSTSIAAGGRHLAREQADVNTVTAAIVNVSGGLTSYEALRRTVMRYGVKATHPIFADTLIEEPDTYRFLDDQERLLGVKIVRLADGRDPWQVMKDRRAITIKSAAPCSQVLKRDLIEGYIAAHFETGTYVRVFGMDWSEADRMERLTRQLAPVPVWFPLADKPYVNKADIENELAQAGVKAPFLYSLGFDHNNCGGLCVKAGQAHWARVLRELPERYAVAEAKEEEIRQHLGKNVTILKDRRGGGPRRPTTLRAFRERLEQGGDFAKNDFGGCGCFVQDQEPPA